MYCHHWAQCGLASLVLNEKVMTMNILSLVSLTGFQEELLKHMKV